jgi:hypothetical protein
VGIDFSAWHPGLILALVAVIGAFTTAIAITTLSVGLVQWRKARSLRDMRDFVEELIGQGYTIEEIERLSHTFFEQRPGQGFVAKTLKAPAR